MIVKFYTHFVSMVVLVLVVFVFGSRTRIYFSTWLQRTRESAMSLYLYSRYSIYEQSVENLKLLTREWMSEKSVSLKEWVSPFADFICVPNQAKPNQTKPPNRSPFYILLRLMKHETASFLWKLMHITVSTCRAIFFILLSSPLVFSSVLLLLYPHP